jgi:putative membrane protein
MAYNLVNAWAFLVATFLLWGAYWALQVVGIDLNTWIRRVVDWEELGLGWSIVVIVGGIYAIGVVGLALNFVTENWGFRLTRTITEDGTALRTKQGLFQTREVHRDERRIRGLHIGEPLFWRWMGAADTEVISTGLSNWSVSKEPGSKILPRGPIGEARRIAALVLTDGHLPMDAPLRRHPRAALHRRLFWAILVPGSIAGLLAWLDATNVVPGHFWLFAIGLMPVTCLLAVIAYRALGHTIVGPYVVLRCGLLSRSTAALQNRAVICWTVRQSIVQRWLGLMTVSAATAAGYRFYQAPDLAADKAVTFIYDATPGWMAGFLESTDAA